MNHARDVRRQSLPYLQLLLLVSTLVFSWLASAGFLNTVNGRSGDLTRLPDLSLEANYNTGDFDNTDYDNLGIRLNYRLSPGIILLGDLGLTEIGDFDTVTFGFGAYYGLAGIFENIDAALKGAFHFGDFDEAGDLDVLEFEFLFSGLEPITSNGLIWYANLGLHRLNGDGGSDTEFGIGGGLVLPVSGGEAYLGIDLIDEFIIGFGYRYFYR